MPLPERSCEQCGSAEDVHSFCRFHNKEYEWLCHECRWPILRRRVFGENATGPPGNVEVPESDSDSENPSGQSSIADYL